MAAYAFGRPARETMIMMIDSKEAICVWAPPNGTMMIDNKQAISPIWEMRPTVHRWSIIRMYEGGLAFGISHETRKTSITTKYSLIRSLEWSRWRISVDIASHDT